MLPLSQPGCCACLNAPPPDAEPGAESRVAAVQRATATLRSAGVASAAVDARILVCAAALIDRGALLRDPDVGLDAKARSRLGAYLLRRSAGEPVSRILGRREFWGLDIEVTPAVLDPRPDTETLVTAALDHAVRPHGRVLDIGTGSGAIVCALLSQLPGYTGLGVDRSVAACRVARANLDRLGVGRRCLVVHGSWGSSCGSHAFDLVVSNPPYVETATIATLERDVRDFDPALALDGGPDGLAAYREILRDLPRLLAPGGTALLEIGAGQADPVAAFGRSQGLICHGRRQDLSGIDRVVIFSSARQR